MNGDFQVKDNHLLRYFHKATDLLQSFKPGSVLHIPRKDHARAEVLSKLAKGKEKGQLSSVIKLILTKPTIEVHLVETA